ncbi:hypothetical protein WA158_007862 [Blastocystis sp. Blastoise]
MRSTFILITLSLLFVGSNAFGMIIHGTQSKCFTEHLSDNVLAKGTYYAENEVKTCVITVWNPSGKVIYTDKVTGRGRFLFNTETEGEYKVCIENKGPQDSEVSLKFRYGIDAKDYSHLAQVQNLEPIEVQMQWIVDSLYEVDETIETIQEREAQIRDISATIDYNIFLFSVITIILLISISISQTYALKRRFVKAKLL